MEQRLSKVNQIFVFSNDVVPVLLKQVKDNGKNILIFMKINLLFP